LVVGFDLETDAGGTSLGSSVRRSDASLHVLQREIDVARDVEDDSDAPAALLALEVSD